LFIFAIKIAGMIFFIVGDTILFQFLMNCQYKFLDYLTFIPNQTIDKIKTNYYFHNVTAVPVEI
jgi:hypothetical protein